MKYWKGTFASILAFAYLQWTTPTPFGWYALGFITYGGIINPLFDWYLDLCRKQGRQK